MLSKSLLLLLIFPHGFIVILFLRPLFNDIRDGKAIKTIIKRSFEAEISLISCICVSLLIMYSNDNALFISFTTLTSILTRLFEVWTS